jgi:hypothetical protein
VFIARADTWHIALDRSDVLCLSLLDDGTLIAATADSGLWHVQNKEP